MEEQLVDIPDVPDDEDEDEDDEARAGASGASRFAGILDRLGPARAIIDRVPRPILAGGGAFVALVVAALAATTLFGGRPTATTPAAQAHESVAVAPVDPLPTRRPVLTPTPRPPTATPTPIAWEQVGTEWIGYGYSGPSRLDMLRPERLLLFDDTREPANIVTKFVVLTASGPGAPQWGVFLSYVDPTTYLMIESGTDEQRVPSFTLLWARDGNGGTIGEAVRAPEIPFWGRDAHELRISTTRQRVKAWLDGILINQWPLKDHYIDGGRKGLFTWFGTRMRFESFGID